MGMVDNARLCSQKYAFISKLSYFLLSCLTLAHTSFFTKRERTWGGGGLPPPRHLDPEYDILRVMPNALNAYFSQIGQTTADSVPGPSQPVTVRLPRVHTGSFEVDTVDIDTPMTVVHGMKPSKATGAQGISVQMLQKFFYGVGPVLLNIVNHSLSHGEVPKSWKLAVITPLPKTVNASAPSHYRPVSILPAITKIIERIVQQQLVQYFTDNCLFTLTRAPLGYFYNAPHWGGAISSPPSDLRNYWTDSKHSSGI